MGYSVHEPFFAYHVPYVDNTERTGMLMKLFHAVENIDSRPVLSMPSLNDFDDQFRPKVAQASST